MSTFFITSTIRVPEAEAVRSNILNITITDPSKEFQELVDCLIENDMGEVFVNPTDEELKRLLEEHQELLQNCRERWLQDGTPKTITTHIVDVNPSPVFEFEANSSAIE